MGWYLFYGRVPVSPNSKKMVLLFSTYIKDSLRTDLHVQPRCSPLRILRQSNVSMDSSFYTCVRVMLFETLVLAKKHPKHFFLFYISSSIHLLGSSLFHSFVVLPFWQANKRSAHKYLFLNKSNQSKHSRNWIQLNWIENIYVIIMNSTSEICPKLELHPDHPTNELAIFACGWFWGPQLRFEKMNGVARAVVGYSGGKTLNPTYRSIQDHTEAILVEFDPSVVSYEDLVLSWTQIHHPTYQGKCQYRSAVWYLSEDQKEVAEQVVSDWKASSSRTQLYTSVEPAISFYRGEEYHQVSFDTTFFKVSYPKTPLLTLQFF